MKDKDLAPGITNTVQLRVTLSVCHGAQPLQLGHGFHYGEGRNIHFTTVKVLLSGFRMTGAGGEVLGDLGSTPVLIEPDGRSEVLLGAVPAVPLGGLYFHGGVGGDLDQGPVVGASWPLDRTDMLVGDDQAQGRYMLRVEGFVDLDGDGLFTLGADTTFHYAPYGIVPPAWCSVGPGVQEQVVAGGMVTRELKLDLMLLLLGVDLLADPVAEGQDSIALLLERNLSTAFR